MVKEDFKKLGIPALKERKKMLKLVVIVMWVSIAVMVASGIIEAQRKGFSLSLLMPLSFLGLAIIFTSKLKRINTELMSRKASGATD